MKELTPSLVQHSQQLRDPDPWVWLFEIEIPTSPLTRYRMARHPTPVTFGQSSDGTPIVYDPFPVSIGEKFETAEGDIPVLTAEVGNPTRELSAVIDEYDGLIGAKVVIRLVNLADTSNAQSQIEDRAEIRRASVNGDACRFALAAYSLYREKFPRWRHRSFSCRWTFGGAQCGYVIPTSPGETVGTGFSTCGKTLVACGERGDDETARSIDVVHPERFGGFPGLPRNAGGA